MNRSRARRGALAVLGMAAVASFALTASPAMADTTTVGGDLNRSGSLVQYDYTRTHTFEGPISLGVTQMPGSNVLRLGLRNMNASGGPQFTDSVQWNENATKEFTSSGTTTILRSTRFAFQGRMGSCSLFCGVHWEGTLTY
ncbi:hypothetical protein [Clavibacter sp. km1a]|uniref:hypothetical protein n=1 Tax=Clavibacter sp. km1a TaxID=3459136 RepID=UPI004041093D